MMKKLILLISLCIAWACSTSGEAWLDEAKARLKKGETVSAKEALQKAIEKNPGLAEAITYKGSFYFKKKITLKLKQPIARPLN